MRQIRTIANRLQRDSDTDFLTDIVKKGKQGYQDFKRNPFGYFFNQNYTGPMTKFEGQPHLDKLDFIARMHDMDYFFAHYEKDPEKFKKNLIQADKNMVKRIDNLSKSEDIGKYGKFVRNVINAKANLTEKGFLPADLFVDRKNGSRIHPYTVGRFGNIENPKYSYEYRDIYKEKALENRKKQKNDDEVEDFNPKRKLTFDSPPKNVTYSQINKEAMDSLNEHFDNLSNQIETLDKALKTNNSQEILGVIQSPNAYVDLVQEAMKGVSPTSPLPATIQLGHNYFEQANKSLQDVHVLRTAHETGAEIPIGTAIPNPKRTRNQKNINYILSTKEQKIYHTPAKFRSNQ